MGVFETVISGQKLRTNHAHIVDTLGRAIVSRAIPSGNTIPGDAELMERFGVSRTVLREALKTLAAKGLIVPRARIGTRVTDRDRWSLFDSDILGWHFENGIDEVFLVHLSEVRLAFEPFAAELAAVRATAREISGLDRLVDAMGDEGQTSEGYAMADLRFHIAVAEASGNPFMRSFGAMIEAALAGVFKLSSPSANPVLIRSAEASHRRIVDAIRARKPAEANAAMRVVIMDGLERVRAALQAA